MRCFVCGRPIKHSAATKTVVETNPPGVLTGHAGRTCARKAGLLQRRVKVRTAVKEATC